MRRLNLDAANHSFTKGRFEWLHVLLRREGIVINLKRTYRLYREERLMVRRSKRKRVVVVRRPMEFRDGHVGCADAADEYGQAAVRV